MFLKYPRITWWGGLTWQRGSNLMKDFILAFFPPVVSAILTCYLTARTKGRKAKDNSSQRPKETKAGKRHPIYRFFTFFPRYSSCFVSGIIVYTVMETGYVIIAKFCNYPRIPLWWCLVIWVFGTAYLICFSVGYTLQKMDNK